MVWFQLPRIHVSRVLPTSETKKITNKKEKKKGATATILKPTDDRKPETF